MSILFLGRIVYSQDSTIGHINISSPTAAALGKYGDVPVSYNTGIPNISIPIYTVESGSIKLPISLSYHAGGLKVQEQASWVGAGWSLNAGGVITRAVIGAPDDRGLNAAHTTKGFFSDYGLNNYLFAMGNPCGGNGPPCPTGGQNAADDRDIQGATIDGEPDMFNFNFNGYTGKFYFNDDRTPIIVPEQDFRITPIYPYTQSQVSPTGILGFIVTTPDGMAYTFGKNSESDGNIDASEITTYITSTNHSNSGQGAVSSWFLNKIVSADGMDSVNLIYASDKYSYYGVSMFPVTPLVSAPSSSSDWSANHEYDLIKNFTSGVKLSKIVFPNGEVDFSNGVVRQDLDDYNSQIIGEVPNTSSTSLGAISIKNTSGFCKKDTFYFGFDHDGTSHINGFYSSDPVLGAITTDAYRLRLDSIKELSCDSSIKLPPYKFSYYSGLVPRKLTFGIDHWGFYNGVTNNQNLIPTYTIVPPAGTPGDVSIFNGADRDTHWPNSQNGVLQQITYPLGGFTSFVYESNDTYTTITTNTKVSVTSGSAGYDGSMSASGYFYTDASSNTYQLVISTAQLPGGTINLSGGISGSFTAPPITTPLSPTSVTSYITLTPSSKINWTINLTGTGGAGFNLSEYIPTTVAQNAPVGGLRIKTITSNDGITSTNIIKSFTYNYGGTQTSGILYSRPVYAQVLRNDLIKQIGYPTNNSNCSVNGCASCDGGSAFYFKSPSSIRPMETVQGNHIGYNQVQVTQTGNGYSIYRYYGSNLWDNNTNDVAVRTLSNNSCDPAVPNFPAAPLPFEYLRGELKYEGHFNESGHILKDVWYFPQYIQDSVFTPGLIVQNVTAGQGNVSGYTGLLFATEYKLISAAKVKDSVVTTEYDPIANNYISTTNVTYYGSPFHHQPSKKFTYNSTGDLIATNIKYANDYRIANCDTISTAWNSYFNAYKTDSLSFYSALSACTNTGTWSCKWVTFQQYRYNRGTDRNNYVALRRTNYMDAGNKFSACLISSTSSADTILKPVLRLQNMYDNSVIESSQFRNSSFLKSYFVRYDTSISPVGYTYPGRQKLIYLPTPSSTFTNSVVSGTTITKDSRYVDETFYNFTKGNVVQTLGKDGIAISYVWDYLNTKPIAKATSANSTDIAFTSFEADGGGNWSIPSSNRDATALTGTKSYNLSSGAITKSNLVNGKVYIVSYWSKSGTSYTVSGGTTTTRTGRTVAPWGVNWTYIEQTVTMSSTSMSISGANDIDELRLYPQGAQMTSYTYSPVVGMTSMNDPNSEIMYYEYDALARLKNIKDYQGSIVKNYQYNYKQGCISCGISMHTFAGTPTISYPVGVFSVNYKLLGNAKNQAQYDSLWNLDAANHVIGTLSAGSDSMHFVLTLNIGQTNPGFVVGCRYYQYDFNSTSLSGIVNNNGCFVDFGDGSNMKLGLTPIDTTSFTLSANTTISRQNLGSLFPSPYQNQIYAIYTHAYSDNTTKTITFYHNDGHEEPGLIYGSSNLSNLRGYFPQQMTILRNSNYSTASAQSVSNIANWNSINSIVFFQSGMAPNFTQDFLKNNLSLQTIVISDTFKISRLKSNWNTSFLKLRGIYLYDYGAWSGEDVSQLLSFDTLFVNNNTPPGIHGGTMSSSQVDNLFNQLANGSGLKNKYGYVFLWGASENTTASQASVHFLMFTQGWGLVISQGSPTYN